MDTAGGSGSGMALVVSLFGDRELLQKFRELPDKIGRKVVRDAVTKSNQIILQSVIANTPIHPIPLKRKGFVQMPGTLRKGIKARASKFNRRGRFTRLVMLPTREQLQISTDDHYYWPMSLHAGHAAAGEGRHAFKTKGQRRESVSMKHVPGDPFLARGFDRAETSAAIVLVSEVELGIQREWRAGP